MYKKFDAAPWEERRVTGDDTRPDDYRGQFVRDRARLIHSAAFRRLQAKTQVLGIGVGDFHRTRLTHSLEVAQVARGIVFFLNQKLKHQPDQIWPPEVLEWLPGANLIEVISLAHDLGHPPFGHGGEIALNFAMYGNGGFEGNGQTLRILSKLEAHTENNGLNLTRRTLLGVLKYPVSYEAATRTTKPNSESPYIKAKDWKPPKCYMSSENDVVDWILMPFESDDRKLFTSLGITSSESQHRKSQYHGLDTSIMELADDIAYGVHDLEDAVALGFIKKDHLSSLKIDKEWGKKYKVHLDTLVEELTRSGSSRKRAIGSLVNAFIASTELMTIEGFIHPLLQYNIRFSNQAKDFIEQLKKLVIDHVIKIPQVQTLEFRGQQLIIEMFKAFESDPERLLVNSFKEQYSKSNNVQEKKRAICDYIAGMTDEYATRIYERLFVPRHGQVFDRL